VVLPLAAVGTFTAVRYESVADGQKHVALVCGSVNGGAPLLVRVHASCLLGDTLGSGGCDCGPQLRKSLAQIAREGRGVLVYLHKGTPARLACTHLQLDGPRLRELGVGAQILRELGVRRIRLLTNNPKKIVGLEGFGLSVVERVPIEGDETPDNREYLKRKRAQGHLLSASR
jgi:3,4-dihydroxy 2-butanone 4-phosphate synthase/GTP cyclohydrolase II